MSVQADIAIYTHRHNHFIEECVSSLVRHTPGSYHTIIVQEPANVHENMLKCFDRSNHRYLVLMDEDVLLVHDDWLRNLIATLDRNEDYGVLCAVQYRHPTAAPFDEALEDAISEYSPLPPYVHAQVLETPWVPAHTMIFDRERCPDVLPDVHVPGRTAMSDVDLCYQVRFDYGLKAGLALSSLVVHRDKGEIPIEEERRRVHAAQMKYMQEKWQRPAELLETRPHTDPMVNAWVDAHIWETRYRCHRP